MSVTDDQDGVPGSTNRAPKPAERRRARVMALQALYQRHMAKAAVSQIEAEFRVDNDMSNVDLPYFQDLLRGVDRHQNELDQVLQPYLDRPIHEVDPIELCILRLGAYELKHRIDVPYKVVLNETIELAKRFGGTEGHKYVNGILDKLSQRIRIVEARAGR
ncbi:transcription antitermination factor NusB [Mangrovitalea sediminis]|uniref:transcription antitermination factor NusB n=1 Tax=Mangrovitalea sediminis TaxID=1982043 RepID=UPI000BE5A275|nr:transcription antitermination factor NusB [Mangrovitalea sediminis]